MTKGAHLLLRKFAGMSGDKKIRIAMRLAEMVRKTREAGATATGTTNLQWKQTNKASLSQ